MTPLKRLLDVVAALLLIVAFAIPFAVLVLILLIVQGRPIFHRSERMTTPSKSFYLWKLRSMYPSPPGDMDEVTGGYKLARVTPIGRFIRRSRLDEIPQLWNVLRGDMSFVGPRPPIRKYVELYPDIYEAVLRCRPGITGLASLHFHRHEEWLLRSSHSHAETEAIYGRNCIPRKARLDLIYQRNRTLCLDVKLMVMTAAKVLPGRR